MAAVIIDNPRSRARMRLGLGFTAGRCESCNRPNRVLYELEDFGVVDDDRIEPPARFKVCDGCLP